MHKRSLLVLSIALLVLCGCNNNSSTSTGSTTISGTTSSNTEMSSSTSSSSEESSSTTSSSTKDIGLNLKDFTVANGTFYQGENTIVSTGMNSLLINNDNVVERQHLEVNLTLPNVASDTGIVFGVSSSSQYFWEGNGVSYYFFFISIAGTAYLGKTNNGVWSECGTATISGYKLGEKYSLGVDFNESVIFAYINGKNVLTYYDEEPLTGNKWGFRTGTGGAAYSKATIGLLQKTGKDDINDYKVIDGAFTDGGIGPKSCGLNNIAIVKNNSFTTGTYTGTVMASESNGKGGIVFGFKDKNNYYRFTASTMGRSISLEEIKNGVTTVIASSYIGASYISTSARELTIVVNNGTTTCKFFDLQYFSFELSFFGNEYGIYSEKSGMISVSKLISSDTAIKNTDVLLFGHSYMQLWTTFDSDLRTLSRFENKTITNMGIGGSVSSQWEQLVTGVVSYAPEIGIFDIGINDLTGGTSPKLIIDSVEKTLNCIKEKLPNFKVVLLSTSRCNARDTADYRTSIHSLNEKFKDLTYKYQSWIKYAEVELAFCDESGNPISSKFKDSLHPANAAYLQHYVPAIDNALNNQDQPTEPSAPETLEEAKAIKKCEIYPYSEGSYRSDEWNNGAKTLYNQAITDIDTCGTIESVKALDLSSYINQLKTIKGESKYFYDEIFDSNTRNTDNEFNLKFKKDGSGVYKMAGFGYVLNDKVTFSGDYSFTIKGEHIKGRVATGGVFINASMNPSYKYIKGYLLNYVEGFNYIQIYYVEGHYGTGSDIPQVLQYIGGYVSDKDIMGINYRVNVKDSESRIYLYENDKFEKLGEEAYCASAPMIYKDSKFSSGYLGVVAWNSSTEFSLEIGNIVK